MKVSSDDRVACHRPLGLAERGQAPRPLEPFTLHPILHTVFNFVLHTPYKIHNKTTSRISAENICKSRRSDCTLVKSLSIFRLWIKWFLLYPVVYNFTTSIFCFWSVCNKLLTFKDFYIDSNYFLILFYFITSEIWLKIAEGSTGSYKTSIPFVVQTITLKLKRAKYLISTGNQLKDAFGRNSIRLIEK